MLDDFFVRALVAGVGVALVAGPLGCFIVWRRMAYFGDTLSHAALLGVALAILFELNTTFGVFAVALGVSLSLLALQRRRSLSSDALLGLLAHSTLAIGLVVLAFMTWVRVDLMALLFGDILAVSRTDIAVIYLGGAAVLAGLLMTWRALFAATISPDLARAEQMDPGRADLALMVLLAVTVAIAMKIVGALLITAMLLIPAATARRFSTGPEQMALIAAAVGVAGVVLGLFGSLEFDTPSGPSIVVAAVTLFAVSLLPFGRIARARRSVDER
ncbi:MAG: metal ABC transporter permease [Roseitalea porphyridii]|jgi:zinc transport system permease protein|uniref:metal ABC transporter permease n=1 Tax=Roseitalea porphyridii TaxID=1852022 RepID=UPI0032D9610F